MLLLSVIELIITNNSSQTLIVKPGKPKMGVWEKTLDSPLSSHSKTRGVVSNAYYVCHIHHPSIYVCHANRLVSYSLAMRQSVHVTDVCM